MTKAISIHWADPGKLVLIKCYGGNCRVDMYGKYLKQQDGHIIYDQIDAGAIGIVCKTADKKWELITGEELDHLNVRVVLISEHCYLYHVRNLQPFPFQLQAY